jgi:glycosyltransferase involved in cell wall biosynthesis
LFNDAARKNRATTRTKLGIAAKAPVLVYVGSVGGAYLMSEMFALFGAYRKLRPGARFLFVTGHPRQEIERLARAQGIDRAELVVVSATRDEVPALIAAADLGVSFILPSYSAKASCPTKFGEMLAMGVPVIANAGVGDIADIIRDTAAGAIVEDFDEASLAKGIADAEAAGKEPAAVRAVAVRYFALEQGVDRYDEIYQAIGRQSG